MWARVSGTLVHLLLMVLLILFLLCYFVLLVAMGRVVAALAHGLFDAFLPLHLCPLSVESQVFHVVQDIAVATSIGGSRLKSLVRHT